MVGYVARISEEVIQIPVAHNAEETVDVVVTSYIVSGLVIFFWRFAGSATAKVTVVEAGCEIFPSVGSLVIFRRRWSAVLPSHRVLEIWNGDE